VEQIALLRGINVGGRHPVPMAALRECFTDAGFVDVVTIIQSGNVRFTSAEGADPDALERVIADRFGFPVPVILRTRIALSEAVAANPFVGADPGHLHLGFLSRVPDPDRVAALEHPRFLPDEFALVGDHCYLHLPNGMARTKLPGYLDRKLGVGMTIRNWRTTCTLAAPGG
jgi:uncharacterized protein (DUF1697 family)